MLPVEGFGVRVFPIHVPCEGAQHGARGGCGTLRKAESIEIFSTSPYLSVPFGAPDRRLRHPPVLPVPLGAKHVDMLLPAFYSR